MKLRPCTGALLAALLAGCATTQMDAAWTDPAVARPGMLRSARVLVACEAYDPVVQRICEDQLASEVTARGGTAVLAAPLLPGLEPGRPVADEQYLQVARDNRARAVLALNLVRSDSVPRSGGPQVSFGIGGVNFGGGGTSIGTGVGVSMPVGAMSPSSAFAANGRLTDVTTGRLAWTARASTPAASDVGAQVQELTRALAGGIDKAGLY